MRVPSFERFQRLMQVTAFFVCGMIVGSAVYNALKIDEIDYLIRENHKLQSQLDTSKADLNQMQKQLHRENVIKVIVPFVEEQQDKPPLDLLTETELKTRLKKDLKIFIGRSIYDIDSDGQLARRLLQEKIYDHVGDKDYEVSIKTMLVVDGKLQVWVEAKVHLPL